MAKKRTTLTQETFDLAKQLLDRGIKQPLVCKALDLSSPTVSRISRAESFSDYKLARTAERERAEANKKVDDSVLKATIDAPGNSPLVEEQPISFYSTYATKADIASLNANVNELKALMVEFQETYAWVAQHAVVDSKPKRRIW